jgi:hypothetical protein
MKVFIVTMVGGIDVIGEMADPLVSSGWAKLSHPYLLQMQSPNNLCLRPMLRGSTILSGDHCLINMQNVMWINEPARELLKTYQMDRAGIVTPPMSAIALNQ